MTQNVSRWELWTESRLDWGHHIWMKWLLSWNCQSCKRFWIHQRWAWRWQGVAMPFLDTVMCTVHLGSGINPSDWLQVTISTYLPHGSVVVNLMLINIHYIHPSHFSSFPLLHLVPSISIISPCGLLIRGCHWGNWQLQRLCDMCTHCRPFLVASPLRQHHLVHQKLSHMPAPPDSQHPHSTSCHNPHTFVYEDVYGHHAPPEVGRLQIFHSELLLTYTLPQILFASCWDHKDHQHLDLWRYPLPVGHTLQNHHR